MVKTSHKVTKDNWSHTHYSFENLRALITFGANWDDKLGKSSDLLYFVTVIDEDDHEVFQKQFQILNDACDYINNRYQNEWPIVDLANLKNKEGGCASCVAH